MGLDLLAPVRGAMPASMVMARLTAAGLRCSVVMVDGRLHAPQLPVPESWRDLRLKTPQGTVSLKRREDGIAVVVFGNATEAQLAEQRAIVEALVKN